MSLFQAREWWAHHVDADEEFDVGGLVVGNVDNDPSRAAKVVTGSLKGMLRVFFPRQAEYKVDDLMLEANLMSPILQLAIGRFIPGSSANALAILHPRKLVVCVISAEGGKSVSHYKISTAYEHVLGLGGLHFTAFNMCYGNFGGVYGKDYICVQSMDGQLAFFEQDHPAFTRQLPNCLIPGPMCYVGKTDSIVMATSDMGLASYKYQMLAAASLAAPSHKKDEEEDTVSPTAAGAGSGGAGRAIQVDWSVNLGEHVKSVMVGRFSSSLRSSQVELIVLGEHTLWCVRDSGGSAPIRLQKRLDYHPMACTMYQRPGAPADALERDVMNNLMVCTHTKQLMVYRDTSLIWAARHDMQPIALAIAEFGGLKGLVVSLSEAGELRLSYMGTDPPTTGVSSTDTKELNYEEMDEEHRKLLTVIRETQSDHRSEPRDRIMLRAQVPVTLDTGVEGDEEAWGRAGWDPSVRSGISQITCRLFVSYTGMDTASGVTIAVKVPDAVTALETSIFIPSIAGGARTPVTIPLVFRARKDGMPSDLLAIVTAAYTSPSGEPRFAQTQIQLPMCVACRLVPPLKNNTFKFTLDTNRMPPALPALFDDMFSQPGLTEDAIQRITSSSANVLSFQYLNGADATILVSKSAGRYRIQSAALESLWLVSSELVRRLHNHFGPGSAGAKEGEEPFSIVYQEPLPLADFFGCIDDHFECRQNSLKIASELNDRAHQFRLIQKRLLLRFKDRNPAPLSNLDVIMHTTHEQLLELGTKLEASQVDLLRSANRLSCATHLLLMLMKYRFGLDEANSDALRAHLSPDIADLEEQGWEERVDAAMTHLLRTSLAKTAKETAGVPPPLAMPADTAKLKKHITYVCDRLSKGALLVRARRSKKKDDSKSRP